MKQIFPTIEVVRTAVNEVRPNKLELHKETGLHPQWTNNFMINRPGGGAPRYEKIVTLIRWLEKKHNVRFISEDQYTTQ